MFDWLPGTGTGTGYQIPQYKINSLLLLLLILSDSSREVFSGTAHIQYYRWYSESDLNL
jgi:hypothetical protein